MKFVIRVLAWFFLYMFFTMSATRILNFIIFEKKIHIPTYSPMHAQPPTVSRLSVYMYISLRNNCCHMSVLQHF
jgi:hypothetical protein